MLVPAHVLLRDANKKNYAVGAFNFSNLEGLQAIMSAAKQMKKSVIIQTTEKALEYAGADYLLALAQVAGKSPIKIALHLDHGRDLKIIRDCIKLGWTSVMFDGSSLPYNENLKKTKQVVAWARQAGVSVEAELGALRGVEDRVAVSDSQVHMTDPLQAVEFARLTGVDSLAISVGTAHGPFKFSSAPKLDIARIREIKAGTRMPLVLHGASGINASIVKMLQLKADKLGDADRVSGAQGVPDIQIKQAIGAGINKINIDSDLRLAFLAGMRTSLLNNTKAYDPRDLIGPGRDLATQVVMQKIKLFSGQ